MNFAYPVLLGNNLFFFVYLIVSAIQMGATIDYAIVITNRFRELRKEGTEKKQAVIETLSQSFPTIFTSGSIMTVAAFLIGFLTSQPLIASIGLCLGRGTLISILCVMTVLPALLYVLDKPLDKTVFKKREKKKRVKQQTIFTRISAYLDALKNVPLPAGGNALLPPVETDTEGDGEQECGEDEERERKTPNEGTKRQKERHGKEERQ